MPNPYAHHLGNLAPLSVIEATPVELTEILGRLSSKRISQPIAPGKWTIHEILAHLADVELVFSARARWILFEDNPTLIGFEQDPWLEGWRREREAYPDTLARWMAMRGATIRMLQGCTPEHLARTGTHSQHGVLTAGDVFATLAGHDLNHLKQFRQIL